MKVWTNNPHKKDIFRKIEKIFTMYYPDSPKK